MDTGRRIADWENWVGHHLRLRDLHVFATVAKEGSMARAAQRLGITQPAVSKVVADLEHTLKVRLLDRGRRGVELTTYGRALLRRGTAAFDELKQSVLDIESLADPASGELRIGCSEAIAVANLPPILLDFSQRYPRVSLSVIEVPPPVRNLTALYERSCDIILVRLETSASDHSLGDDANVEELFEDRIVVAVNKTSRWARRRKIDLADLADTPWILTMNNTFNRVCVMEAFQSRGLALPPVVLMSQVVPLRAYFLAHGNYVATFATSILRFNAELYDLKELPIHLSDRRSIIAMVTLKNRMLSPIAERFIAHIREFTKSMRATRGRD
ncbi:MAG TPA: LysR family transcriptional regulator [Pseudolabrys sp.]|nr:LysR family transcriptional regulator [Pseudolabrys sp.]